MCVYCFIADWMREYSPWQPAPQQPVTIPTGPWMPWGTGPIVSLPMQPPTPIDNPAEGTQWTRKQLDEALEILRRVKEMEDALGGCPCEEPSKMDFLEEIKARLDRLEAAQKGSSNDEATESDSHPISE